MIPLCEDKQPLDIARGTTAAYSLAPQLAGAEYTLEDGDVLIFTLRHDEADTERILIKKLTNKADGAYYLEFVPEDTAKLPCGRYVYSVGIQRGSTILYEVIKDNSFYIRSFGVKLGDGG